MDPEGEMGYMYLSNLMRMINLCFSQERKTKQWKGYFVWDKDAQSEAQDHNIHQLKKQMLERQFDRDHDLKDKCISGNSSTTEESKFPSYLYRSELWKETQRHRHMFCMDFFFLQKIAHPNVEAQTSLDPA